MPEAYISAEQNQETVGRGLKTLKGLAPANGICKARQRARTFYIKPVTNQRDQTSKGAESGRGLVVSHGQPGPV
jgi:hypothetical protein